VQKISPFLWFDNQAEEAVKFYISIFKNSKIGKVTRYGKEGYEIHRMREGTVMTIDFEIEGQKFVALNGGPMFKFNEAISFQVNCKDQKEVDYYWENLSEGGDKNAQQCGCSRTNMEFHGKSYQSFWPK
jgi:predicted 3-demethylubiquinone-9 3-methyltransferase (glyoxalase superfamily)